MANIWRKKAKIGPNWSEIGGKWGEKCEKVVKSVKLGEEMVKFSNYQYLS